MNKIVIIILISIAITAAVVLGLLFMNGAGKVSTSVDSINYTEILSNLKVDYTFKGDIHYDPVNLPVNKKHSITLENIKKIDHDTIEIEFSQNNYTLFNGYMPAPEFSYTARYKINDTFVPLCRDYSDPKSRETLLDPSNTNNLFEVFKYLGIQEKYGVENFVFYHNEVRADKIIPCIYPQIIEQSHNVIDLQLPENLPK